MNVRRKCLLAYVGAGIISILVNFVTTVAPADAGTNCNEEFGSGYCAHSSVFSRITGSPQTKI